MPALNRETIQLDATSTRPVVGVYTLAQRKDQTSDDPRPADH